MVEVAKLFRAVLDKKMDPAEAMEDLEALWTQSPFSNGFLMGAEGVKMVVDVE